ncbi:TPA: hypothetical protein ACF54C_004809 [Serratia marcescens]
MQKVGNTTDTADANGEYTNGNVAQGIPPTIINAEMLNTFQRELVNFVEGAELTLDPSDYSQLLKAIQKLSLGRKQPFAEIKSDNTVETALNNLGVKSAAKRDVGAGANQIPDMSLFAASFGSSGGGSYFNQPNGTLVQYSYAEITGPGPWTLSFPIAFPNTCRAIVMTDAGAGAFSPGAQILSKTQFNAYSKAPEGQKVGFYFICIGN